MGSELDHRAPQKAEQGLCFILNEMGNWVLCNRI